MQLIAEGSDVFLLSERHPIDKSFLLGAAATELLLHSRSAGAWSSPVRVAEGAPQLIIGRFARDGSGDLHFLWWAGRTIAAPSPDPNPTHDAFARYRKRSGAAWFPIETLYERASAIGIGAIGRMAADTDFQGRAGFVYHHVEGGFRWLFAQDGSRHEPETLLIPFMDHPTLSVGGTAGLSLTYTGGAGVWTIRYRDDTWGSISEAHRGPGTHVEPRIAVESTGRHHLLWPRHGGNVAPSAVLHATSTDGVNWSAPITVAPGVWDRLQLAIDRHDRLHLLYETPLATEYRRFENGVWSAPASPPDPRMSHVQLAFDGEARLHAAWRNPLDRLLYHASLDVSD